MLREFRGVLEIGNSPDAGWAVWSGSPCRERSIPLLPKRLYRVHGLLLRTTPKQSDDPVSCDEAGSDIRVLHPNQALVLFKVSGAQEAP
jgi:hypothetical protein